jgi:hypothetical protein
LKSLGAWVATSSPALGKGVAAAALLVKRLHYAQTKRQWIRDIDYSISKEYLVDIEILKPSKEHEIREVHQDLRSA